MPTKEQIERSREIKRFNHRNNVGFKKGDKVWWGYPENPVYGEVVGIDHHCVKLKGNYYKDKYEVNFIKEQNLTLNKQQLEKVATAIRNLDLGDKPNAHEYMEGSLLLAEAALEAAGGRKMPTKEQIEAAARVYYYLTTFPEHDYPESFIEWEDLKEEYKKEEMEEVSKILEAAEQLPEGKARLTYRKKK